MENTAAQNNTNTANTPRAEAPRRSFGGPRGQGPRGPRPGGRQSKFERVKPEFDQKIMDIRRVTRVVAGGRRFSFSVVLVAGNRKGKVGVGIGKAGDTSLAIEKALNNAKRNMITVNLTKENSLRHEVEAKFGSSRVMIKPAPGRGLIAGSAVRTVLELAGIHHVNSKISSRSKNKLNIGRATILALKQLA